METDEVLEKPEVDRWPEGGQEPVEKVATDPGLQFFRLSGGLMRAGAKTANRIDGLLTRMMEQPSSGGYRPNLDGNLDYLLTSLQLDMIGMFAGEYSESWDERPQSEPAPERQSPPTE